MHDLTERFTAALHHLDAESDAQPMVDLTGDDEQRAFTLGDSGGELQSQLTVSDGGRGIDSAASGGTGLVGLRDRVAAVGHLDQQTLAVEAGAGRDRAVARVPYRVRQQLGGDQFCRAQQVLVEGGVPAPYPVRELLPGRAGGGRCAVNGESDLVRFHELPPGSVRLLHATAPEASGATPCAGAASLMQELHRGESPLGYARLSRQDRRRQEGPWHRWPKNRARRDGSAK